MIPWIRAATIDDIPDILERLAAAQLIALDPNIPADKTKSGWYDAVDGYPLADVAKVARSWWSGGWTKDRRVRPADLASALDLIASRRIRQANLTTIMPPSDLSETDLRRWEDLLSTLVGCGIAKDEAIEAADEYVGGERPKVESAPMPSEVRQILSGRI